VSYPIFLSTFVGRKNELGEIKALIREGAIRLLTLTGPGGCGKTRLASEVFSEIAVNFEDGVAWVSLVGLSDPGDLLQEIAATLNVRPPPGQTVLTALSTALQQQETLIVLDNCEHLLDASARLVDGLLRACPGLRFLATSRQKLGVEGEQVWPVPPLSYPAADNAQLNSTVDYDALQLFSERARLVNPGFEIGTHNAPALIRIAQLTEGMPLAIELAAARVNELDVWQMAERLEDQLAFLAHQGHTAVSRHQSMRKTIHWSFELLTAAERTLFRRLGVFQGGFSLKAIEAVCGAKPLSNVQILDLLGRLIDKSLVIRDGAGSADSHYRQLESIRQYAFESLQSAGEENAVRDLHLAYFSHRIREAQPHLLGPAQKHWTEQLAADYDNLQAALAWSIHRALEDPSLNLDAAEMVNGLYWFWNYAGRHEEARDWYARIMELPGFDPHSHVYADLKHHLATFVWLLGNYPEAKQQLQDCLRIAEAGHHSHGCGHAKLMLGILSLHQGQTEQAVGLLRESERLFHALGDPRGLVITYANLGGVSRAAGDLMTAQKYAEKAVQNARACQDLWGLGLSLSGLADVLYRQGQVARAFFLMEEALEFIQSSGQRWLQAEALWRLADMMHGQGKVEDARQKLEECYNVAQESGAREWQLSALKSLGFLCMGHGDNRQAAGHFSEILRMISGQGYEHILVHTFLGVIQLAVATEQWRQAVALWEAYKSLKTAHGFSAFEEEAATFQSLQPYIEMPAYAQTRLAGNVDSLVETTGLALEIIEGVERRVVINPSEYRLRMLGLGPTEVYLNGQMLVASDWTFAKPRELLYYLASNPPKTKEQIGLAFWPDASPAQLRVSLRATLYHLRRALGERAWIHYEDGYYRFNRSMDYWYDVEAFEQNIAAAEKMVTRTKETAIEKLEAAVSLYRGDFLSDLANDQWGALRREELQDKYRSALKMLGELLAGSSAFDRAIEVYRKLVSHDLLMEEAHRELMRCYALKGERALALRQYQLLLAIMQDELGLLPSPETTALFRSLQQNTL